MNGPLRSKQGCWTCRLRRKKCDERHPSCATCDSLEITCYGYGAKPEWMDGGSNEKAMAASIKQIVKTTSRRKARGGVAFSVGRLGARMKAVGVGEERRDGGVRLAPKENGIGPASGADSSSPGSSNEPQASDSASQTHGTSNTSNSPQPEPASNPALAPCPAVVPGGPTSIMPANEAFLLMHYLDNVFPLQFPMYKPSFIDGGRGWFLSLLLRTKPLYHAALALASFHTGTLHLAARQERDGENWRGCPEEEEHIHKCLTEFRGQLESLGMWTQRQCPKDTLGIMGCIIQLIYFELFARRRDIWLVHLKAATEMFAQCYSRQTASLGLTDSLQRIERHVSIHPRDALSEDITTFEFMTAILVWLDILSSITAGKTPRLIAFHPLTVSPESPIEFRKIVGCSNWTVIQIGRIAALHEYKMLGIEQGTLTPHDLEEKASEIRETIKERSTADCLASLDIVDVHKPGVHNPLLISRIFARTASVYLHLVVCGYQPDSERLDETIREVMVLFREHVPRDLTLAIVFPLYIFGCVARKEDEDFFRDVLTSAPILDPAMEHRGKLLPLMENIWRMRDVNIDGWAWKSVLLLSEYNLLLV